MDLQLRVPKIREFKSSYPKRHEVLLYQHLSRLRLNKTHFVTVCSGLDSWTPASCNIQASVTQTQNCAETREVNTFYNKTGCFPWKQWPLLL